MAMRTRVEKRIYITYDKTVNPQKRFTKEEWEKGFMFIDKARTNAKKYPQKEIKQAINQAVREIRQTKRII